MTRVKYLPAGPPYELGEQAPLILFTQVGPNGEVLRVYNATPPPWEAARENLPAR